MHGKFGLLPPGKASSHSTALPRLIFCFFLSCVQCFCVTVIHQTLTWTTGSLMCVREHSYACVYTWGLGTSTTSQHNILTWKHSNFSCAPGKVRTCGLWISSRCSTNWATPLPHCPQSRRTKTVSPVTALSTQHLDADLHLLRLGRSCVLRCMRWAKHSTFPNQSSADARQWLQARKFNPARWYLTARCHLLCWFDMWYFLICCEITLTLCNNWHRLHSA